MFLSKNTIEFLYIRIFLHTSGMYIKIINTIGSITAPSAITIGNIKKRARRPYFESISLEVQDKNENIQIN